MLDKTELYYFSPTGGTEKVGRIFCEGFSKNLKAIDLGLRDKAAEKPESDLIVVAMPVFGGRIPATMAEKLNRLEGNGKKAVTLVVYGNRAYEDALLELNNIMEGRGFCVAASAALVAQHSMAPEIGEGRPDEQDRVEILDFAGKVLDKAENGIENPVKVPGNYPYKEAMNMPVTPLCLSSCSQCGACVDACPVGAIERNADGIVTDARKCMLCMACTAVCPDKARILPPSLQEKMGQMLGALKSVRGKNEFFL